MSVFFFMGQYDSIVVESTIRRVVPLSVEFTTAMMTTVRGRRQDSGEKREKQDGGKSRGS